MKKKSGSDPTNKMSITVGSGCGSVGRAVASDTRDPRFQSSHQQNFYRTFVYCQLCWKDEKRPGMAHFLNANHKIVESIWLVEKSWAQIFSTVNCNYLKIPVEGWNIYGPAFKNCLWHWVEGDDVAGDGVGELIQRMNWQFGASRVDEIIPIWNGLIIS